MAKCLVLGANGFIGSHLVDSLIEAGHSVRCFDRYKSNDIIFANTDHKNIEIFRGDFLNRTSIAEALEDMEYVFHFISTTNPITSENDPVIDIETNIKMGVELFKLCAEKNIKRVIFASTGGAIYGDYNSSQPLKESLYPKPISPYAIGKLTIESYLRYFKTKHDLDHIILRISNPYGPRQNNLNGQGVIPIFLERIKNNQPITIFGNGSMVRDYIYVGDVAKAVLQCFESKDASSTIYNLGSGRGYTVNELVDSIEQVTGQKANREEKDVPPTFVKKVVLDTNLFAQDFGELSPIPLSEGMNLTWEAMKIHNE